jgi:transcription-repair coupling factor (superfamily II helicase)
MLELELVMGRWKEELEELMAFMNGEFDVLVATTIIESGLDVPNANTIFINNANNFGLSDLHQMRGRDEATRRRFVILSVRRIQQ